MSSTKSSAGPASQSQNWPDICYIIIRVNLNSKEFSCTQILSIFGVKVELIDLMFALVTQPSHSNT